MSAQAIVLMLAALTLLGGCAFMDGFTQWSDGYCEQHPAAPPSRCWSHEPMIKGRIEQLQNVEIKLGEIA
jgi:hypothetical protein